MITEVYLRFYYLSQILRPLPLEAPYDVKPDAERERFLGQMFKVKEEMWNLELKKAGKAVS